MALRQVPASFTAGRALKINGTSYAKGAAIPAATVAGIRRVSALLSRGWIVPNVDQTRRRLGRLGQQTPRPQTLPAVERKKLGAP